MGGLKLVACSAPGERGNQDVLTEKLRAQEMVMMMMMMMIVEVFTLLGRTGFLGVADLKKCFFYRPCLLPRQGYIVFRFIIEYI